MFKELRNRFLLINLVTTSVVMLSAFLAVFLIAYNNVSSEIFKDLNRLQMQDFEKPMGGLPPSQNRAGGGDMEKNHVPPPIQKDMTVSFTLILKNTGEIDNTVSFFAAEDSFYEEAKNIVLSNIKEEGRFHLNDVDWAYLKRLTPDGTSKIVFVDISNRIRILGNLIYAFSAAAIFMVFAIFMLSRNFANKAIEPIEAAFEKQKRFVADASHELKTPISVINTNVDLVLDNGQETVASQTKWLHYIKTEGERMTKLINDLLLLTKMDYVENKIVYSEVNISSLTENVFMMMEAVAYEKGLSLHGSIEPNLKIKGDAAQLKQVLMILLDNAIKYSFAHEQVLVSLKKTGGSAQLSVANKGDAIGDEHIDKIFDRFYRPDQSRARESGGYGLGLAIAKSIVEKHNGKIYVKRAPAGKTVFSVDIPLL